MYTLTLDLNKTQSQQLMSHNKKHPISNELLGGGGGGGLELVLQAQPQPQFLKWYKTFSWLFSLHDNPLTRQ